MTRTIIIGGGIAGLATAALLAREGHRVTILERGARVGGRSGTFEQGGFRFDTGPSWYLMPRVFEHFFSLLGTSAEEELDLQLLDPGYLVFPEPHEKAVDVRPAPDSDSPVAVPAGSARVRELFEELEPGSGPALDAYLESAARVSRMAEQYFLYNPFTKVSSLLAPEILRAGPELAKLLSGSLAQFVAKRFSHPVIRQILGYPAVFLGSDPRSVPALYHLMSTLDLDEGVLYPRGGFWELVQRIEALARAEGVTVSLGAEVTAIMTNSTNGSQRAEVAGVRWVDEVGIEHLEEADIVVSAADLHHTETTLLPERLRTYPESWWQKRVSGPGAVLVLLGVRGKLPELPHHSLFFSRDWDANFDAIFGDAPEIPTPPSLYVCTPSKTDQGVAPEGDDCLFVLVPIPPQPEIGFGGTGGAGSPLVEQIADTAIDQIASWAQIPDLRERIVVRQTMGPADFANDYHSWKGGLLGPAHTLRQSAMFRAQNESQHVSGLFYAGATVAPGVGIPMCLISAELVLKRIRGDHSAGPTRAEAFPKRQPQAPGAAPSSGQGASRHGSAPQHGSPETEAV